MSQVARRLERGIFSGLLNARVISRDAGMKSLSRELDLVGVDPGKPRPPIAAVVRDSVRAERYAKNYARQWAEKAKGETVAAAASAATEATESNLARLAATESAEAFNGGRAAVAEELSPALTSSSLLKVWDATLDKRTCPICALADGTIVGIKENFPQGVPGAVHPWCRCTWHVLTFEENGDTGLIEPKEPTKVVSLPAAAEKPPAVVVPTKSKPAAEKAPKVKTVKAVRVPKDPQLKQLLDEGFTGGVPQSGLRPESFQHLRAGGAVHGGEVTLKIRADGGVQVIDGRHRITLARERGVATIQSRVLVEGARGGIKSDVRGLELKLGQANGAGEQFLAPTAAVGEKTLAAAEKAAAEEIKSALKASGVKATGDVSRTLKSMFGRIPSPEEIHGALGLESLSKLGQFRGDAEFSPYFGIQFRGGTSNNAVSISRKIYKDDLKTGSVVTAKHESLFLSKSAQGKGLGAAILREQVGAYEKLGVGSVTLDSAEVGRYYWPKVGFSGSPAAVDSAKGGLGKWMEREGLPAHLAHKPTNMREIATLQVGDRKVGKEFLLSDHYPGGFLKLDLSPESPGLATFKREVGLVGPKR